MNVFAATPSSGQLGVGLLLLRLALGAVFIMHGGQKLFQAGFAGTTEMMSQMGVPAPGIVGPLLSIAEPLAGVALILGFLTRLAGLVIAIDMICAIFLVHLPNGFFVPMGIEFVMMNAAAGLTLAFLGAGPYSIDYNLQQRRLQR